MNNYKIEISNVIKEARTTKKYSLRKLAKLTGLSHSFLGDIESGRTRPKYENLIKIITVLDIPLEEIFLPQKYVNNE
ncbi:transcriptional regulator with XRE-family HTH domain [Anaerosolibacter carboniphilus]|uniref:Transcriptional regulator with XRE-family HTH domain n=1 Tax=Anaerosolibacter carboniphilus TaxID=1417629 RepID=A0A841KX81_9FIRM|nr:helix-turn-helix transcriptional regulator [Anaerosolibacter carboniphilus]MBB6214775.1 transcriptional regulator with XRE-family HTH domain [Anaerosolibacter carboniphilus]